MNEAENELAENELACGSGLLPAHFQTQATDGERIITFFSTLFFFPARIQGCSLRGQCVKILSFVMFNLFRLGSLKRSF